MWGHWGHYPQGAVISVLLFLFFKIYTYSELDSKLKARNFPNGNSVKQDGAGSNIPPSDLSHQSCWVRRWQPWLWQWVPFLCQDPEQGWGTAIVVTSHFLSNVTVQRHKRSSFPQLPLWGKAAKHIPWYIPCAWRPQSVSPFPTRSLSRVWVVIAALNKHWVSSNLQQSRAGKEAAKEWLLLGCRTSQLHLSQLAKLLLKLRHTWCTRQGVRNDHGDKVTPL